MKRFKNYTSLLIAMIFLTGCQNDTTVISTTQPLESQATETTNPTTVTTADTVETSTHKATSSVIADYRVTLGRGLVNDHPIVILRTFRSNGSDTALIVDDTTYETTLVPLTSISNRNDSIQGSNYEQVLQKFSKGSAVSNEGLRRAASTQAGTLYLSADLCPSTKTGFEQDFFKQFITDGHKNIAIALSVGWVKKHAENFDWLLAKQATGELNITWVNHSENHTYDPSLPLHKNFMLKGDTDIDAEILETEKLLLRHGQVPSVFFRFPGLVADQALRTQLTKEYGLIPLGSDAWLAKGEAPHDGSIILIHGNRNEPKGIDIAETLLQKLKKKGESPFKNLHKALEGSS